MTDTTPLFGDNPTQTYTNFIGEVWSQKINMGLNTSCVMLQCVNRDYQADADKGADSINIITPAEISTGAYSGTIDSYGTSNAANLTLDLDQNVYFGLSVPDIDEAQSNVSIIDTITQKAKKAVERAIDQYLFSFHTQAAAGNIEGTTDSPVSLTAQNVYSKFVSLAKKLKVAGALDGSNPGWVVVHPDIEEILLLSDEFTSASTASDATIREGAIGKIAGLDVFVSNNVGKNTDHYVVLAGTNQAVTYASQLKKVETIRAQASFDSIVRGLYTFGAVALNDDALAVLICDVA